MISPFQLPPHPQAQQAAQEVIEKMHAYMRLHLESELHRQGKMFGVLVYEGGYLAAFSAKLDGSYYRDGFVPPVNDEWLQAHGGKEPIGTSKEESRRLQQLLFAGFHFVNGNGESKNLLDIFANEKPIVPADEWFNKSEIINYKSQILPPSGAGECCAPKLLQYALTHGLKPVCMAEFWVGAPPKNEIRQEGTFYAPCSGRCVPILRHMLQGLVDLDIYDSKFKIGDFPQPEILFEDEYLMVVNKPSGVLSVPGKTEELSVESYFRYKDSNFKFIKAVHRLDQDTSGLLVLAKNAEVYKALQAYFQRRDIFKRYETVVKTEGVKELKSEGVISLPLLPNPYDRPRQMVDKVHGRPAITRYVIRERRADGTALVDFFPLTGRTHQLRVHAAHPEGLNAPIVGDRLYGTANGPAGAERLMLHAAEIRFVHPVTQNELHFFAKNLAYMKKK